MSKANNIVELSKVMGRDARRGGYANTPSEDRMFVAMATSGLRGVVDYRRAIAAWREGWTEMDNEMKGGGDAAVS